MSKRRKSDEEDLGFRTPTKRPSTKRTERPRGEAEEPRRSKAETSRAERPKKTDTGRAERPKKTDTGRAERPSKRKSGEQERPQKTDTGRAERPSKRKSGEQDRPEVVQEPERAAPPAPAAPAPAKERAIPGVALLAGLAVTALVGGLAVMLLMGDPPAPPPKPGPGQVAKIVPEATPRATPSAVAGPSRPAATPSATPRPVATPRPLPTPTKVERPAEGAMSLEELAKKSATHAAIARILEEHMALFDPEALRSPGPNFQPFHERRRKEEELLERLRQMGPLAVDALKEMLLALGNRSQQIFLGKAMAGIEGPEALGAVKEVLGQVKDMAIQLSLTRTLPSNRESADLLAAAFGAEADPNLRTMLMREYNHRLEQHDPGELFRTAAADPDPRVRSEAIVILGRRGRAEDMALLERIVREESDQNIRKRAIFSLAQTGKESSLTTLESVVRDPQQSVGLRASAVLGISVVGGEQAMHLLDQVGASDPSPEVRERATRAALNLRRNIGRAKEKVEPPPERINPRGIPIERE
ncbi:MAG: HEAT repeat domain-containing protein [Planctomycetota bacterium]